MASLDLAGHSGLHLTNSSTLRYCLSLIAISIQNIEGKNCFLPEKLMIKESFNLIEQEHILVNHFKVYIVHYKNALSSLVFN